MLAMRPTSTVAPLSRTVVDGFAALSEHGDDHIKIVIVPNLPDPVEQHEPQLADSPVVEDGLP